MAKYLRILFYGCHMLKKQIKNLQSCFDFNRDCLVELCLQRNCRNLLETNTNKIWNLMTDLGLWSERAKDET